MPKRALENDRTPKPLAKRPVLESDSDADVDDHAEDGTGGRGHASLQAALDAQAETPVAAKAARSSNVHNRGPWSGVHKKRSTVGISPSRPLAMPAKRPGTSEEEESEEEESEEGETEEEEESEEGESESQAESAIDTDDVSVQEAAPGEKDAAATAPASPAAPTVPTPRVNVAAIDIIHQVQRRLTDYSEALRLGSVTHNAESGAVISALVSTSSLLRYTAAPTAPAAPDAPEAAGPPPSSSNKKVATHSQPRIVSKLKLSKAPDGKSPDAATVAFHAQAESNKQKATAKARASHKAKAAVAHSDAARTPGGAPGMQEYDDIDGVDVRHAPSNASSSDRVLLLRHDGDSDSDSDDSVHMMYSDEEDATNGTPLVIVGPNGKRKFPKLVMTRGERSLWTPYNPNEISKCDMVERVRRKIVARSAVQLHGKGRVPGETMASQYVVLFQRVLQKGRDNPYNSYETLARWVHRTTDRAMREHLCKQFIWPDMNAPEVKKWLSNVMSGFRVLQLVFPEPPRLVQLPA